MRRYLLMAIILVLFATSESAAHFAMILPSDDIIGSANKRIITLRVQFLHPFEYQFLEMAKPKEFAVLINGKKKQLLRLLKRKVIQGKSIWFCKFKIKKPGDYLFYVKPKPYWEPAEEKFIIHYAKVVINAFGLEQSWDKEIGLPVEIIPLTRPYGIWAGNVFVGLVKYKGKPLPNTIVEVEYYNDKHDVRAPADAYITQRIKTDDRGIFIFGIPKAGWWGFAALTEADYKIKREGKAYPVELGGILWIRARRMH